MRNDSLRTKEGRLQARAAVLENLRKDGAKVVEHKDADCITVWHEKDGRITIRLYSGTAYQPDIYEAYHVRSREYAQEKLTKAVQNREQRRKAALDQRGKRTPSPQAQTAAAIRARLATVFPGVKFSVTSSSASMCNSVDIEWTDGPVDDLVDFYTRQYQYDTYDAYQDYHGVREIDPALNAPGAKFVFCHRRMSDERRAQIEAYALETFGHLPADAYGEFNPRRFELQHRELWPDEYRAEYDRQAGERERIRQEAQKRDEEAREKERRQREEGRKDNLRRVHHLARVTALAELETDPETVDFLNAKMEEAFREVHGEVLRDLAARLTVVYIAALGDPRHFTEDEIGGILTLPLPDEIEDADAVSLDDFASTYAKEPPRLVSGNVISMEAYKARKLH